MLLLMKKTLEKALIGLLGAPLATQNLIGERESAEHVSLVAIVVVDDRIIYLHR